MNTILSIALPLIAAWIILSIFYQGILRNVLSDAGRFALFRVRDEVRRLGLEGEVDANSFAYRYLEEFLCRLLNDSSRLSISGLIELQIAHPNSEKPSDMIRFEQEAGPELRKLQHKAIKCAIGIMSANSPGWTILMGLVGGVGMLFGWAVRQWLEVKTAVLVESDVSPGNSLPA